jgi:hypothetical protein
MLLKKFCVVSPNLKPEENTQGEIWLKLADRQW